MAHFVIEFLATINGTETERGKVGSSTPDNDHRPNTVKRTVEEYIRKMYPEARNVAVNFLDVKQVSPEEYMVESKNFIQLGGN